MKASRANKKTSIVRNRIARLLEIAGMVLTLREILSAVLSLL